VATDATPTKADPSAQVDIELADAVDENKEEDDVDDEDGGDGEV
jgi:hypothetical protein